MILLQPSTSAFSAGYDKKYSIAFGYTLIKPGNDWCEAGVAVTVAKNRKSIKLERFEGECNSRPHESGGAITKTYAVGNFPNYTLKLTSKRIIFKETIVFQNGSKVYEEFEIRVKTRNNKIYDCDLKNYRALINSKPPNIDKPLCFSFRDY